MKSLQVEDGRETPLIQAFWIKMSRMPETSSVSSLHKTSYEDTIIIPKTDV